MSAPKKLLFVFGTRPEAIKLAPVIKAFQSTAGFEVKTVITGQHRQMLDQVLHFFDIHSDYDLQLMKADQTIFDVASEGLRRLEPILFTEHPDLLFVQGDTTTAFIGALAAYFRKIKVAHVEAGLRSHNKYSPFPEEMNRLLTGQLADLHLAPTSGAVENLQRENITTNVHVVGNSVIDALLLGLKLLETTKGDAINGLMVDLPIGQRMVLITGHRRESFGEPFENMCRAIADTATKFPDTLFVYPVHLNPNVRQPVQRILGGMSNVKLLEPLEYPQFISLVKRCHLVLTDSGGLQEEAPSLGKPVLVMREVTERTEGIEAGTARLVGTSYANITKALDELLTDDAVYERMAHAVNPYGDGNTSERIVRIVQSFLAV
jgi:UDP-N-acetylglucosamine 2-epimerase (non-hydrolysing)